MFKSGGDQDRKDVNYSLICAVREGRLERVRELINYYGLSYSQAWAGGYYLLCDSVKYKHAAVAKLLLTSGSTVNSKDKMSSKTPLHFAVVSGDIEIVKIILEKGANIDAKTLDGRTPLHDAIKNKNMEVVELLLKHGADVNARDNNGITPLHIATKLGHETVVKLLLQHGAKVDSQDEDSKTILHLAVERGYLTIVKDVLKYCPDINDQCNRSPLKIAVHRSGEEYKKIVEALLEYGLMVNPEDKNNSELLHAAVKKGYLKMIEDLLKYGADVNMSKYSMEGFTPLHSAAKYKQEEVAKLLISYEADINPRDETGKTPIFYAIENADLKITKLLLTNGANIKASPELLNIVVKKGCIEIVEALLQHDADINASDKYGRTALHYTPLSECKFFCGLPGEYPYNNIRGEIAKLLLSKGAKVDAQTKDGATTLKVAIQKGDAKVVEALLEYNAIVNFGVKKVQTPLHLTAQSGNKEISTMLLNKGANVNAKQKDGSTALHIAVQNGYEEVVKLLLACGANVDSKAIKDVTPLHLTAINGNKEISIMLLNKGADVNAKMKDGTTALHIACENAHEEVVKVLLACGANVDSKGIKDATPLHITALNGNKEISIMLLKKGANVNAKLTNGATALHIASLDDHEEVVKVLLEFGADMNSRDEKGRTALYCAIQNDCEKVLRECSAKVDSKTSITFLHLGAKHGINQEIIETILKFGVDINSRDEDGRTALHIASEEGHDKIVVKLLEYGADINITSSNNQTPLDHAMAGIRAFDSLLISYGIGIVDFDGPDRVAFEVTAETLNCHIVKMKTANLFLSETNLLSMKSSKLSDFKDKCEKEIASMKSEKINDLNVSFYDILAKGTSSLAIYMKNENIVQVSKSDKYKTKFPIYASMIESNFRKGMERKKLLDQGNEIFHFLFDNFPELPYSCTEKIFSYLSDADLRILMDACKPLGICKPNTSVLPNQDFQLKP